MQSNPICFDSWEFFPQSVALFQVFTFCNLEAKLAWDFCKKPFLPIFLLHDNSFFQEMCRAEWNLHDSIFQIQAAFLQYLNFFLSHKNWIQWFSFALLSGIVYLAFSVTAQSASALRSQRPDFSVQSAVHAAAVQLSPLSRLVLTCVCT